MRGDSDDDVEGREEEERGSEEELELGLSLGARKQGSARWGPPCRILMAKDLPVRLGESRAPQPQPSQSDSSSVSSSSVRAADTGESVAAVGPASPEAGSASQHPSTQVVVGWPPIRAFRMNSLFNLSKENNNNNSKTTTNQNSNSCSSNGRRVNEKQGIEQNKRAGRSLFVKVNMDGDPIGRKLDLTLHQSYESLAVSLESLFHGTKGWRLLDGSSEFVLTYKDKDGDWMLVGDVPWGMFLETVKRLRIMRNSDTNGLGPRFQSSNKFGGLIQS